MSSDKEFLKEFWVDIFSVLEKYDMKVDDILLTTRVGQQVNLHTISENHFATSCLIEDSHTIYSKTFEKEIRQEATMLFYKQKIANGYYVIFIDDSNKPEDFKGDWPIKNKTYKVIDFCFDITKFDGSIGYKLEGLKSEEPYLYIRANRFKELQPLLN